MGLLIGKIASGLLIAPIRCLFQSPSVGGLVLGLPFFSFTFSNDPKIIIECLKKAQNRVLDFFYS